MEPVYKTVHVSQDNPRQQDPVQPEDHVDNMPPSTEEESNTATVPAPEPAPPTDPERVDALTDDGTAETTTGNSTGSGGTAAPAANPAGSRGAAKPGNSAVHSTPDTEKGGPFHATTAPNTQPPRVDVDNRPAYKRSKYGHLFD